MYPKQIKAEITTFFFHFFFKKVVILWKDKPAKGEKWAPPLIMYPRYSGSLTPNNSTATRL